jgi:hypothetical protein
LNEHGDCGDVAGVVGQELPRRECRLAGTPRGDVPDKIDQAAIAESGVEHRASAPPRPPHMGSGAIAVAPSTGDADVDRSTKTGENRQVSSNAAHLVHPRASMGRRRSGRIPQQDTGRLG